MRREERVTVQGPVKEQQPDGMSHKGLTLSPAKQSPYNPLPPFGCAALALGMGAARDALEGGKVPATPSWAPSPCPVTVPLTPSASLNGICNRQ